MIKRLKKHTHLLHKTGMFLSFLCLVHCLATPFILTALPLFAKDFISHKLEVVIIGLSLLIGLMLLIKDYRIHHNIFPLLLLLFAATFQCLAWVFLPEKYELIMVVIGSMVLALAYIFNWHLHRKVCDNHNH